MNFEDFKDAFEPFEKLVEIEVLGESFMVPENNSLLRCFQYLSIRNVSLGDFCWNGDCANCQIWIAGNGSSKPALSCRTIVEDGMKIVKMADEIKNRLISTAEIKPVPAKTETRKDSIF